MRISDWSSDVCSSELEFGHCRPWRRVARYDTDCIAAGHGLALPAGYFRRRAAGWYRQCLWRHAWRLDRRLRDGIWHRLYFVQLHPCIRVHHPGAGIAVQATRLEWGDALMRSEERRVGKEGVSTCRYRGKPEK